MTKSYTTNLGQRIKSNQIMWKPEIKRQLQDKYSKFHSSLI